MRPISQKKLASKVVLFMLASLCCTAVFAEVKIVAPPLRGDLMDQLSSNGNQVFKGLEGIWDAQTQAVEAINLRLPAGTKVHSYDLLRFSPNTDKLLGYRAKSDGKHYAFIADRASGEISDLPPLLYEAEIGAPTDIDAMNQTIVGTSHITTETYSDRVPLVWHYNASTQRWQAQALPTLSGRAAIALKISRDGSTIVGDALEQGSRFERATIWTKDEGNRWQIAHLGTLTPSTWTILTTGEDGHLRPVDPATLGLSPHTAITRSSALAVSADGQVVMGDYETGLDEGAFIWNKHTGMVDLLAHNPDWKDARARGLSGNGKVVVGSASERASGKRHAVRWTEKNGQWRLQTVAQWAGATDPNNDDYHDAIDVSDDGDTLLAYARDGQTLVWLRMPARLS